MLILLYLILNISYQLAVISFHQVNQLSVITDIIGYWILVIEFQLLTCLRRQVSNY